MWRRDKKRRHDATRRDTATGPQNHTTAAAFAVPLPYARTRTRTRTHTLEASSHCFTSRFASPFLLRARRQPAAHPSADDAESGRCKRRSRAKIETPRGERGRKPGRFGKRRRTWRSISHAMCMRHKQSKAKQAVRAWCAIHVCRVNNRFFVFRGLRAGEKSATLNE